MNYLTKINLVLFVSIFSFFTVARAQVKVVGDFLRAGPQDGKILAKEYLSPLASGVGAGFNSGWINRAKAHKPFGFNIQMRSGLALVPGADETFNLDKLKLSDRISISAGGELEEPNLAPTISGRDKQGPELVVTDEQFGAEISRFRLPNGAELDKIPTPFVQASFGLIKGVEITGRFIPEVSFVEDFGEFKMWGFGGKANINQWFELGRRLPFDITVIGGFNRTKISDNMNILPSNGSNMNPELFDNQEAELTFDSFVGSAIVGRTISSISLYTGLGFQTSEMEADFKGTFPVPRLGGYDLVEDPISFTEDGDNSIHGILGIQFKLGLFTLSAEYTLAEFQTLNAGLGVSFR